MGCVNYKMKKFHAALHYFSRALYAVEKLSNSNVGVSPVAARHHDVLYNLGLVLVVLNKPQVERNARKK